MKKINVLFVCLGNICRSPLAEGIFLNKIVKRGLEERVTADSCGTSNYHIGSPPDLRTTSNAKRNGIAIDHCGRQLHPDDLKTFDYILAMDKSNYQNILRVAGDEVHTSKIKLMRDFDPEEPGADVPDPYHGGEEGFQHVFEILDRSMENFVDHLQSEMRSEKSIR